MLGLLLGIFACAGGIGAIALADTSSKALGLIPIALYFAGVFVVSWFPSRDMGLLFGVALTLEIVGAVLGMYLYQRARTQKMNRAIAED